jgi:hypothetical protein
MGIGGADVFNKTRDLLVSVLPVEFLATGGYTLNVPGYVVHCELAES